MKRYCRTEQRTDMVCLKFIKVHSGCSARWRRADGEPEGNKKAIRIQIQKSGILGPSAWRW